MSSIKGGLVVCTSKYGSTSEYGSWIAGDLGLPLLRPGRIDEFGFRACEYLIIGSPVYNGKLLIGHWLARHRDVLATKRLFFFIVCATATDEKGKQGKIVLDNIPLELVMDDNVFFLPGRVVAEKLSFMDKLFVRLGAKLEKDPVKRAAMLIGMNGVSKAHIVPLVARVGGLVEQVL